MIPLCAVAVVMGVFPTFFLKPMEPSVTRVVERLQNTQTLRVENAPRLSPAARLREVTR